MNKCYIVTGSYQTLAGNLSTFRLEIAAHDSEGAMNTAEELIKGDKRRRYARSLDMSCSA